VRENKKMVDQGYDQIESLVVAAFSQARRSGKVEWDRMTTAVLKNRLLALTDGAFRESDYGASSMVDLVSSLSKIVAIDISTAPATVSLVGGRSIPRWDVSTSAASVRLPTEADRIRADLWRAIMDYASGNSYGWDGSEAKVFDEPSEMIEILPTLTSDEMRLWRQDFLESFRSRLKPDEVGRVEEWVTGSGKTSNLLGRLQREWNGFLKKRVWERLEQWFSTKGGSPVDLLQSMDERRALGAGHSDLRRYLIRTISQMSSEELAQVQLPASAVWRLSDP
jgi:hypothetical protein